MSQRRKSSARKRKAEEVDEKESDSSSSSSSSSSSVKKTKTPAKPKTSAKKSAQKKSAAKSSAKKTSLKTGGEMRKDDEEEEEANPPDYVLRPGKMDQAVNNKKARLKKETFRTHFRVTNVTGRKKKVYWTDEEIVALQQGYDKHGRKWTEILLEARHKFNECRTSVDLKDKYDGMTKNKGKTRVSVKKSAKKKEEEEEEEEEGEEEVTANSPSDDDIYDGDIRIRMQFGKRGKMYKLIGSGHFTYAATIEGCRMQYNLSGPKNHRGESIVAGLMQGEESDVLLSDAIGSQIPLPHEKKEKPIVYIIVSKKQSSI